MPLGQLTRQAIETRAAAIAEALIGAFNEAEELRRRCAAELAAGTLDTAAFYQGDPADKANVLGFLDDMHAVYSGLQGQALPTLNYRRYLDFLTGV